MVPFQERRVYEACFQFKKKAFSEKSCFMISFISCFSSKKVLFTQGEKSNEYLEELFYYNRHSYPSYGNGFDSRFFPEKTQIYKAGQLQHFYIIRKRFFSCIISIAQSWKLDFFISRESNSFRPVEDSIRKSNRMKETKSIPKNVETNGLRDRSNKKVTFRNTMF